MVSWHGRRPEGSQVWGNHHRRCQRRGPPPFGLALSKWRRLWSCLALLASATLGLTPLQAQTTTATWVQGTPAGTGSSNWQVGNNWDSRVIPTGTANFTNPAAGRIVTFPPGGLSVGTMNFGVAGYMLNFFPSTTDFTFNGAGIIGTAASATTVTIGSANIVRFVNSASGGTATFNINPGGTLDLSGQALPGFPAPANMT